MPVMMSVNEIAAATGLSVSSVKRACYKGELPSKKFGKRRLVRTVDFEAWTGTARDQAETHSDDEELGNRH